MLRDLIWTIIGLWILWRLIGAFRSFSSSSKRTSHNQNNNDNYQQNNTDTSYQKSQQKKGELKPDAGEYVDYEEIK